MKNLSKSKMSKNNKSGSLTYIQNIWAIKKPIFLIFDAKKIFYYLRQVFIKALILQHFDFKYYIQIASDILDYAIGKVLSKLSTN